MSSQTSPEQESFGNLGRQLADDAARLLRSELELVKAEAKASVTRAALATGLFAGAGLFLLLMLIFALAMITVYYGPSLFGPGGEWKGWGMFAAVLLAAALALGALGGHFLRRALRTGKQAAAGIKEDVEWARQLPKRNDRSS